MKAVLCPVCNGSGKYKKVEEYEEKVCHGCEGKGWVEVHEQLLFSSEPVIPLEGYTELTYPLGYS